MRKEVSRHIPRLGWISTTFPPNLIFMHAQWIKWKSFRPPVNQR